MESVTRARWQERKETPMTASLHERRVREILSKDVIWIRADETVLDALTLMVDHKLSALPVGTGNGQCVGMLSATDLIARTRDLEEILGELDQEDQEPGPGFLERVSRHDVGRRKVSEVMVSDVATISPEATLTQAGSEMLRHRVHRLPVVDGKKHLVGVISTTDLIRAFVEAAPKK
jgi:CBS domain-containing protein